MGVFGIALTQFLFYLSVRELPVGVAMLLQFTAPLFIAVWFRVRHREVVKNMVWVGLALSIGITCPGWANLGRLHPQHRRRCFRTRPQPQR